MGRIKTLLRNINYLMKCSLWDQREEDIVYLTNKILDDGVFEYNLDLPEYKKLKILSKEKSLDFVIDSEKSFVRMGDGEIKLMLGQNQPFQKYDPVLADKLKKLLENNREDLLIGINKYYFMPRFHAKKGDYMRRNAYDFREFFFEYCNFDSVYLDGAFTYSNVLGYSADEETSEFWNKWKAAFKKKNLVIVCGEKIVEDMKYNIFEEAETIKYIYGPRKNAWDKHDEILEKIKKENKEQLFVFILGMAGKVMASEISDMGYVAWDIGHLAKGYNVYKMGMNDLYKDNIINFYSPD